MQNLNMEAVRVGDKSNATEEYSEIVRTKIRERTRANSAMLPDESIWLQNDANPVGTSKVEAEKLPASLLFSSSRPRLQQTRLSYCLSRATRRPQGATGGSGIEFALSDEDNPRNDQRNSLETCNARRLQQQQTQPEARQHQDAGDHANDDHKERVFDHGRLSMAWIRSRRQQESDEHGKSRLLTSISISSSTTTTNRHRVVRGREAEAFHWDAPICSTLQIPDQRPKPARTKLARGARTTNLLGLLVQLLTLYELAWLLRTFAPFHKLGERHPSLASNLPTKLSHWLPTRDADNFGGELVIFARASEMTSLDEHSATKATKATSKPTSNLELDDDNHWNVRLTKNAPFEVASSPGSARGAGIRHRNFTTNHHHNRRRAPRGRLHEAQPRQPRASAPDPGRANHESIKMRQHRKSAPPAAADLEAPSRPLVASRSGLVRGITQKLVTGKFVDAFLGIPFARPPKDQFRFRHPVPIPPWTNELDASRLPNSCFQLIDTYFGASFRPTSIWNANTPLSEDCLYLNVWTPFGVANITQQSNNSGFAQFSSGSSSSASSTKRPVLVWIFGGGFYSGTSTLSIYEGGVLASEEDVIVVSMNYRVSALGFLYFERPDAPGNAGLFDQLMALQWINDNIDQFGGDPARVTIFGESAGAVSVALHLLSPLSRNLFDKAILQSGAATCPWGIMESREIKANGIQLAKQLNCPANSTDLDGVLECLLKADPMDLISQEVGQPKSVLNFPFVPVVDGSFLLESPIDSLLARNFKQAPLLLGSNNDEGNAFLVYMPEFSHCPTGPSSPVTISTDQIKTTVAGSQLTSGAQVTTGLSTQPSSQQKQMIEMGGEHEIGEQLGFAATAADKLGKLHSLDLIASGRQHQGSSNVSGQLGAAGSGGASGQHHSRADQSRIHESLDFDPNSKPCELNEYPSLGREDFLNFLRDHQIPMADNPIGEHAIVYEYSNWNSPFESASNYEALDKIVGDYYFTCHVNEFAQHYSNAGNPVFMYYFRQRSTTSVWPKWLGVLHGDEILFVFGEPLNQQQFNYTAKEVELSKRMMRYWANFARYGHPTRDNDNNSMPGERWPDYSDRRQYFELNSEYSRVGRGPRSKQCAFWFKYLPELLNSLDQAQCNPSHLSDQRASRYSSSSFVRHQKPAQFYSQHLSQRNKFTQPYDIAACPPKQRGGLVNCMPASIVITFSLLFFLALVCLIVLATRRRENGRQMLKFNLSSSSTGAPTTATGGTRDQDTDEASQTGQSRAG